MQMLKQTQKNQMNKVVTALVSLSVLSAVGCSQGKISSNANVPNTGIIGGTTANGSEEFSKTVASIYNVEETRLCTASILSDSILITAGHCVDGDASALRVIFGTDLHSQTATIVQQVEAYKVNPAYATNGEAEFNTGDVALVKFSGGLPQGFHPANVLTDVSVLTNGSMVLLAGYGISDGVASTGAGVLRSVETTILKADYSETELLVDQTKGKGACHGDSGGPAYSQVNGTWMLWGITDRVVNDPQNNCSVSSAYTSIPAYADWIAKTSAELMRKKPRRTAASL